MIVAGNEIIGPIRRQNFRSFRFFTADTQAGLGWNVMKNDPPIGRFCSGVASTLRRLHETFTYFGINRLLSFGVEWSGPDKSFEEFGRQAGLGGREYVALNSVSSWNNFTLDQTSYWLAKCIQPDKLSDPARQLFVEKRLLLWNFFPFFRGGFGKTSGDGLPPYGASYKVKCLQWLFTFVQAVDATEVIVASNNVVFPTAMAEKPLTSLNFWSISNSRKHTRGSIAF